MVAELHLQVESTNAYKHEGANIVRINRPEVEKIKSRNFRRTVTDRIISQEEDHRIAIREAKKRKPVV